MARRLALSLGLAAAGALLAPAGAVAAEGTLVFSHAYAGPGTVYIEGYLSYLRVSDGRGRVVLEREVPFGRGLRQRLPAGSYRVRSWQRPCEGTCGQLDPATDGCSGRFTVHAGGVTSVRALVRPGRACALRMRATPALYPSAARIGAAVRWLRGRRGVNSLALIDTHGHLHGFAPRRVYVSASVVKAMLLVSYLRKIGGRTANAAERGTLGPMIMWSDNARASAIFRRVGAEALRRLARRAGMRRFSVGGRWAGAHFSAEDQARFFSLADRLVPPHSRAYARRLLSSIILPQRWGFSRYAAAADFQTFFKGGWRSTGRGRLVHEAALFERREKRFSLAVLTDGNPTHGYGAATLGGVAARVFGRRPAAAGADSEPAGTPAHRSAGLVDLLRFAPSVLLDIRYASRRNLTGRRLPGYCRPWALLTRRAARDLAAVQRELARRRAGLLVWDAYRPARASRALVRWAQRTGRGELVGTYIARRSRHNTGSAVDLTLVRLSDGRRLDMGTGYDSLGSRAHTLNARGRVLRNRLMLERAMERHGFRGYSREWWHFEHRVRGPRYLDLPLGCA